MKKTIGDRGSLKNDRAIDLLMCQAMLYVISFVSTAT